MKKLCLSAILLLRALYGHTQATDTLRICTYNLLNYGNSANTYNSKNLRLQPILSAIRPSIQCFNEVSTAVPGLLDTLLHILPFPSTHGPVHNTTGTTQLDGLFWQSGKLHLLHDSIICSDVRDIVAYDFYYDYPGLAAYNDTVKLTIITAHLKSSSASTDKAQRAGETQKVSAYLSALNKAANYVMLGDFNLYTSSEAAWQNLTNPTNTNARLNDPLNRIGSWDNNASFGDIDTQSPRLAVLSDGGASGGLDSRFDFILMSDAMISGSKGIKYLPGTYHAFGNDGLHFGKAITDSPANTMVSAVLAQALYTASDHLPVFADLAFTPMHLMAAQGITATHTLSGMISAVNPFNETIQLFPDAALTGHLLKYRLVSMMGQLVQEGMLLPNNTVIRLQNNPVAGIYFLQLQDEEGSGAVLKLLRK